MYRKSNTSRKEIARWYVWEFEFVKWMRWEEKQLTMSSSSYVNIDWVLTLKESDYNYWIKSIEDIPILEVAPIIIKRRYSEDISRAKLYQKRKMAERLCLYPFDEVVEVNLVI